MLAQEVCATVQPIEPYLYSDRQGLDGFSVDLWDAVADRVGVETVYAEMDSVEGQLGAVLSGDCDVATTAVSMTSEREAVLDFSHPVQEAGLRIAVPADGGDDLGILADLFTSQTVLAVLATLLVSIMIMGVVVWLIERRQNPEFRKGATGAGDGLWWAAVTAMTVGYGDKIPRKAAGRVVTVVWMLCGVVLVALLTAAVTAEIAVDRIRSDIRGLDDLYGEDVVVVAGTTSEEYAVQERLPHTTVDDVDTLIRQVSTGSVDAAILDGPVLEYEASGPAKGDLEVVGGPLNSEYYAFAFPDGSDLRDEVNQALLELDEDGTRREIHDRWFG